MKANPNGLAALMLATVRATPGIDVVTLAADARCSVAMARATMRRYEQAEHVSSDVIDGRTCYWLERDPDPTVQDRILARLATGPAVWADLVAVAGHGVPAAMAIIEQRGLVRVEKRTVVRPDGRRVARPNLYHAGMDGTVNVNRR